MKKLSIFFFGILFLALSCSKENNIHPDPDTGPVPFPETRLNLSDLQVGQKSYYQKYTSKCDSMEQEFEFTGDTLIVEVIEIDGQLYLKEQPTPHSTMYLDGTLTKPVQYPVHKERENILVLPKRQESALFFFYGSDSLIVKPSQRVNLVQNDCKMYQLGNPFIGNDIGKINRFQIGEVLCENKTAVSCVPITDLDAYLIYDENELHASHAVYVTSFWDDVLGSRIIGWTLLK